MPSAANPKPTSSAAGISSIAHGDIRSPIASITTTNPTEYIPPRITAQLISPSATSIAASELASMPSYSLANLSLKNTFIVESSIAPFIAEEASNAGAMYSA